MRALAPERRFSYVGRFSCCPRRVVRACLNGIWAIDGQRWVTSLCALAVDSSNSYFQDPSDVFKIPLGCGNRAPARPRCRASGFALDAVTAIDFTQLCASFSRARPTSRDPPRASASPFISRPWPGSNGLPDRLQQPAQQRAGWEASRTSVSCVKSAKEKLAVRLERVRAELPTLRRFEGDAPRTRGRPRTGWDLRAALKASFGDLSIGRCRRRRLGESWSRPRLSEPAFALKPAARSGRRCRGSAAPCGCDLRRR